MISADQREEILKRLREGETDAGKIAVELGVPKMAVAGVKKWLTMGHYSGDPQTLTEEVAEAIETTFGLERDLQEALRKNIGQLEDGLKITDEGKERHVPAGFIDITAEDKQGRAIVIELKAGTADREALGQILSYMGDLQIADAKTPVRGILVAADFTARAIAAAKAAPNIQLMTYAFKFSFHKAG